MPVAGTFHGAMPRFLKESKCFVEGLQQFILKPSVTMVTFTPHLLRYFWNRMYLCTYTLNSELNTTMSIESIDIFLSLEV